MARPLIAYLSMLRLSTTTITDPGTETGFLIGSIKDMKAYMIWKSNQTAAAINIDLDTGAGTEQNADYIALVNHNLNTLGATVRVFADAAVIGSTQVLAATTPGQDTVTYLPFTAPGTRRFWRITINHSALPFTAKPFIGDLFMGMKTELPEFMSPSFDPFFFDYEIAGSRSEGGHYLAGTVRGEMHRGAITFGAAGAARSWFTSDGNAFIRNHAAKRHPFFFVLDTADTDFDDARYLRVPDDARLERLAVGGAWSRLTFHLPVEEAFMEPVPA